MDKLKWIQVFEEVWDLFTDIHKHHNFVTIEMGNSEKGKYWGKIKISDTGLLPGKLNEISDICNKYKLRVSIDEFHIALREVHKHDRT